MKNFVLILHIVTSFVTCILTGIVLVRAIFGLLDRVILSRTDVRLPLITTLLLYLQLVLGTVLFVMYMSEYGSGEIEIYQHQIARGRFWAVEHFILMVFTLVVSHIGWVFARSSHTPQLIFKKNLLYFGIAFAMIIVSMAMNIARYGI